MRHLLSKAAMVLAVFSFFSCGEEKFRVEGNITGAKDSVLYFENMGLQGPVTVDSVKLDADGSFAFEDKRPEAPDFYRLRIAGQIINVSVDSTETIKVKAEYNTMPTGYEIEGSSECLRIKELTQMQIALQNRALGLEYNTGLSRGQRIDSLEKMLYEYKNIVKSEYIFKDPKAASSYFALFQTLGNYLIFNPQADVNDTRVFAAVATCWDTYYPDALRTGNLHNIAVEALKNERIISSQNSNTIDPAKVTTTGLIDIQLPDNKGNIRSLTELKGKVVLLDFHLFAMKESPKRILMLRELYNKYHDRGLEFYQVSLDPDEHFWKQQTSALPWISVRDADGAQSSRLRVYNISNIPEFFIIDRGNNLVKRSLQIKDLDAEIQALL
ncbi:TlpA disulfide reductase family protein [Xylanibacter muris]|nr:TlpA disulfide reductase family protein [Xylanibacter muris]